MSLQDKQQCWDQAADGIKIVYDTWLKRGRPTGDYANARLVEQWARQIGDEFARDPEFNAERFYTRIGMANKLLGT